jgi:hypothetical protein
VVEIQRIHFSPLSQFIHIACATSITNQVKQNDLKWVICGTPDEQYPLKRRQCDGFFQKSKNTDTGNNEVAQDQLTSKALEKAFEST